MEYTEINVYNDARMMLKESLESQYNYNILSNNIDEAYNIIGRLMAYRLIDKNDERISTGVFSGKSNSHRFKLDLRKNTNYIAEWLVTDLPNRIMCELKARQHWGIRVEGIYQGDIVYPETTVKIGVELANAEKQADSDAVAMCKIWAKEGKAVDTERIRACVKNGVTRIYEINVFSNALTKYKRLGYIYIYNDYASQGMQLKAIITLNGEGLVEMRINIGGAYDCMESIIKNRMRLTNIDVVAYSNHKKEIMAENALMREDREKTIKAEKIAKINAEKIRQRELEKAKEKSSKTSNKSIKKAI